MKKILLTLVGVICSLGMWADDTTIFSLSAVTGPTDNVTTATTVDVVATITGGTVKLYNGKSSGAQMVNSSNQIKLNGSSKSYCLVTLSGNTLQTGDKITFDVSTLALTSSTTKNTNCCPDATTFTYTVTSSDQLNGKSTIYIWNNGGGAFKTMTITRPAQKTATSESFKGVKIGGVASTAYTQDGTTITLTNSYVEAPTVALVKTVTYSDASTEDADVAVALTQNGDYFEGTASIGLTGSVQTYTVKAPVDKTVKLGVFSDDAYSTAMTSGTITSEGAQLAQLPLYIKGQNLTDDVTLALNSSVDGLYLEAATVAAATANSGKKIALYYFSDKDVAAGNITVTVTSGDKSVEIPVTYSSTKAQYAVEDITPVSASTTWDFSKAASTTINSPANGYVIAYANATGWTEGFNYQSLAGNCQRFADASNKCTQGIKVMFKTTVPGTIKVKFSNTGSASSSRPYRYLAVNGTVYTSWKSKDATDVTTDAIYVPAGDVVLTGIVGTTTDDTCEPTTTENMLRIYSIEFTAAPSITLESSANLKGYKTFYNNDFAYKVDPAKVRIYKAEKVNANASEIVLDYVTSTNIIPAQTPVVLRSLVDGDYNIALTPTSETNITGAFDDNALMAATEVKAVENAYVLGYYEGEGFGFYKYEPAMTLNQVYVQAASGAKLNIVFSDDAPTAVSNVNAEVNTNKSGKYIENGRVVIVKNGKKFNAAGALLK